MSRFMAMLARVLAPAKASALLSFNVAACNGAALTGHVPKDTIASPRLGWPILPMRLA
jgi:hypothetical protein